MQHLLQLFLFIDISCQAVSLTDLSQTSISRDLCVKMFDYVWQAILHFLLKPKRVFQH